MAAVILHEIISKMTVLSQLFGCDSIAVVFEHEKVNKILTDLIIATENHRCKGIHSWDIRNQVVYLATSRAQSL